MTNRSEALFEEANQYLVGGVNSAVRAFRAVGGTPVFMRRGQGAWIEDVDGRQYVDYVLSYGPLAIGHAHPAVVDAIAQTAAKGTSFGAPTELETELARKVQAIMPGMERLRMVNSGTEACMSAVRLARGYTGRDRVLKFRGNYHGHVDALLVEAGSGVLTLGIPGSPGVPAAVTEATLTAPYNDIDSVRQLVAEYGDSLAAILVEPVSGNMNCVPALPEFLQGLRDVCDDTGALLVFDEVMSGFRASLGGAQAGYGIHPDLTCLGKVIGGGLPTAALGGRAGIMDWLAPTGPVYQAGTLSGNPLAMASGLTTLTELAQPGVHAEAEAWTARLLEGLRDRAARAGVALRTHQAGTMFGLFFTDSDSVVGFEDVAACDGDRFVRFFQGMLEAGVYLAPSAFKAGFVSTAHDEAALRHTLDAAEQVFADL